MFYPNLSKAMKFIRIILLFFVAQFIVISCSEDNLPIDPIPQEQEQTQYFKYTIGEGPFVYFEDLIFKELVLNNFEINTNKDNEISFQEANAFKGTIDVSFKGIQSLTGIEKFVDIVGLNCANNKLSTLDVSGNLNLEFLGCGNNPLTEIDLSYNVKLKNLDIRTTQLTHLDLSDNTNLVSIRAMCNYSLKTVDVANNNNDKILIFFFGLQNSALECVQVDNVAYSNTATNWRIPETAIYSLSCFDSVL
jgi:hypothetical protein